MKRIIAFLMSALLLTGHLLACSTCGCERNNDNSSFHVHDKRVKKDKKKKNWCPKCDMPKKKCPCGKK